MSFYDYEINWTPKLYYIDIIDIRDGYCQKIVSTVDAIKIAYRELSNFLVNNPFANTSSAQECLKVLYEKFTVFELVSWNKNITYSWYEDSNNCISIKIENGVLNFRMNLRNDNPLRSVTIQVVKSHE